jgi:hypothetical protein
MSEKELQTTVANSFVNLVKILKHIKPDSLPLLALQSELDALEKLATSYTCASLICLEHYLKWSNLVRELTALRCDEKLKTAFGLGEFAKQINRCVALIAHWIYQHEIFRELDPENFVKDIHQIKAFPVSCEMGEYNLEDLCKFMSGYREKAESASQKASAASELATQHNIKGQKILDDLKIKRMKSKFIKKGDNSEITQACADQAIQVVSDMYAVNAAAVIRTDESVAHHIYSGFLLEKAKLLLNAESIV